MMSMTKILLSLTLCSLATLGACGDNAKANSLVITTGEPAGPNCPGGGTKIDVGVDGNGDGALDADEITNTSYACNGTGGTSSLVATSDEPAGTNCPFGGTKIETGLDANGSGTLEPAEVNPAATSYVCNVAPSGTISPSTGIVVAVKPNGVSTSATGPITVRFTIKDDRGYPLDIDGDYSLNTAIQPRFALGWFTKTTLPSPNQTTEVVSPLTMYTKSASTSAPAGQPTAFNPKGTAAGNGTLVENGFGAGDYTYTFPTTSTANGPLAVAYDPTKLGETHVVWIQASRQTDLIYQTNANTYYAANQPHYYIPSGTGTPMTREIASQAGCDGCHGKFKAETTASAAFHGGGRVAVGFCNTCHNPGRTTNPSANSSVFVHRIHNGANVATANLFHGIAATYPQDIRTCDTCHAGAAQGAQALSNPTIGACGGCHDYVSFTGSNPATCGILGSLVRGPDGKPVPCNHGGGPRTDAECATCHGPAGGFPTANYHKPVVPPDPKNAWNTGATPPGTNNNTNASFVAAGGYVPPGAIAITYDVKSVEAVDDAAITPSKRPRITFKFKGNGTDVVFQTFAAGTVTELMPNFVGSPSVYFAFTVPQDSSTSAGSDFNATVSGYIKKIWDGSATGTGAGTMTGPDAMGYYTITLTGVQIPPEAKMLTGGVGFTYSLSSAPPLIQTNVPGYPWTPNVAVPGTAQGGLSVPAPNIWKVATGYTGRRPIVENAKCIKCHGALGVTPNFHGGLRNDGPTCAFCHNPNRSSAGWSASSKFFIHAIHAGRKRTVNYTWHAAAAGPGYDEIEFPGTLNTCTTCHLPGTYDFTNSANLTALASEQLTTVASGTLDPNPLTNSTYYTVSPYVPSAGGVYGAGFSYNASNTATPPRTTEAAGTTLVATPLTAACVACHDSSIAVDHMRANGGHFYAQRSTVLASTAKEQCMICHGPGRVAAIGAVHQR